MNGWFAGHGSGAVVINIMESGADVVAIGSGTLNIGVIPETSFAMLLGVGAAGLAFHRRRGISFP